MITLGIYQGSFSPPHLGHLEVVQHCLSQNFTEIYILANEENPYKTDRLDYASRKKMLEILFKDLPQVKILDGSSRDTIKTLRTEQPTARIVAIAGTDRVLASRKPSDLPVDEWFIIPRHEYSDEALHQEMNGKPISLANPNEFMNYFNSSTAIRDFLAMHDDFYHTRSPFNAYSLPLHHGVYQYIKDKMLYRNQVRVIKKFLKENPDKLPSGIDVEWIRNATQKMCSLSGDAIFVVKDTEGEAALIVKQFKGENRFQDLAFEIQAMKKINELKLKYSCSVQKFFVPESDIDTLLVMEIIKDKTLKDYMDVCKENPHDLQHKTNLHAAIRLYAKALAELNSTEMHAIQNLNPDEIKTFTKKMHAIAETLARNHSHYSSLDMQLLQNHIQDCIQAFLKNPGYYGYTHGDPNPSNYFINLEHQKVKMIDAGNCASKWMAVEGDPRGFPANEFFDASSCIVLIGRRLGLSESLSAELENIFIECYKQNISQQAAHKEAQNFFRLFWMLRAINTPLRDLENHKGRREYAVKAGLLNQLIEELKNEIGQNTATLMQGFGLKLNSGGQRFGLFNPALSRLSAAELTTEESVIEKCRLG